ncbi:nucleotide pyrophosphatase [Halobacteriales archaeon SW_7_68_16]|nr:MAG: nucleotide pyrophosphatase [Halobacteriales archaeon SW_7_68_16]
MAPTSGPDNSTARTDTVLIGPVPDPLVIRTEIADRLDDEYGEDGRLFPAYDGHSFGDVSPTLLSLLADTFERRLSDDVLAGVDLDVDHVVCVLLDGFGYRHWTRHVDDVGFLRRLTDAGTVTPLTSVYPSETAAAVPTFHTGVSPAGHGSLGWYAYDPRVERVIQSLPFTTLDGEPAGDALGLDRSTWFDAPSLYPRATDAGIDVHHVVPESIEPDDGTGAGYRAHGYGTVPEAARSVRQVLADAGDPTYVYAYFPDVDAAAHDRGTTSETYAERLGTVCSALEGALLDGLDAATADRTLLAVVADHGMVDTDPERNVDLAAIDGLWETLARTSDGEPIPPVGGPRNCQLHLCDGYVDRARTLLTGACDGVAFTRQEALDRDLFGPDPGNRFRERLGDLVFVPDRLSAWHTEGERSLVGMHGGLHPEEQLTPLALARLDRT